MKGNFYDIESLDNVFSLVNFKDDTNECDVFYLIDNESDILQEEIVNVEGGIDPITGLYAATKKNVTYKPVDKARLLELITQAIYDGNEYFHGKVNIYNLREMDANDYLAQTFGLSDAIYVNNPDAKSSYNSKYRLRCDTDPDYDPEADPYFFGYNSYNYDTTMLAMYLYDTIPTMKSAKSPNYTFKPISARLMRQYNDELFSDRFKKSMPDRLRFAYNNAQYPSKGFGQMNYKDPKAVIRKNMLMSGRHIDVARLNEKQSKVGLKRLLGMLGYQILESDKLAHGQSKINNLIEFLSLIAYNVSDCINLRSLFNHKAYQSGFALKKQLLKTYPDLVYQQKKDAYAPDVSPYKVRNDRLFIDSSSAQLATKALCPYGHLRDYDTVSFMYPSEAKAAQYGIERVNVLEETKKFFYANFPQPELRAQFDEIYNFYKSIEGKNFNESENYLEDHDIDPDLENGIDYLPAALKPWKLSEIKVPNTCMFYFNKDGSPSRCFVNFSTGGIHGAEFNQDLYEADLADYEVEMEEWQAKVDLLEQVKKMFGTPEELKAAKGVVIDDIKYKPSDFVKSEAVLDANGNKTKERTFYWKDAPKAPKKPEPFKASEKGSYKLDPKYTYTSFDLTNHEDFTSYYPNMLRMMDAFFNEGLGYDRYGEIFDDKTKFGIMMKDPQYTPEQQGLYSTMRNGTKLILNSASGAGDANFESNIRMNNKIISMRIIGQLFTWRIGQAQTIEGAKMTSTNTDGLYSVLEATLNDAILKRESDSIHVEIEPEPIYLISKDSNNRMEIEVEGNELTKITGASGGTLGCRKGPNPEKSLAHPAILDWALAEYLILAATNYEEAGMSKPFSDRLGMSILKSARGQFNDDVHTMTMFQNVIASSPGSQAFVFATYDTDLSVPIALQHYNRCFIVKDKTPDTVHLQKASAKAITPTTASKRKRLNEKRQQHNPIAVQILEANDVKVTSLPPDKEAAVSKITGVEENWYIKICNRDLHYMPQADIDKLFDEIDYDKYLILLRDSFENNWRNILPEDKNKTAGSDSADLMSELFGDDDQSADDKSAAETENKAENKAVIEEISLETETGESTDDVPQAKTTSEPEDEAESTDPADENYRTTELPPNAPRFYHLNKTCLTDNDLRKGERQLNLGGVRIGAEHEVLAKLLKVLTNTDID